MESEYAFDPYERDLYHQLASKKVSDGQPLQNVLAVQQAGPCDDEQVTELIRAVLPLDELDQAQPKNKGDARVGSAERWERCEQGVRHFKAILEQLFKLEVDDCLKMYEGLDQGVIDALGVLLRKRVHSCDASLLKHRAFDGLEVTSEQYLKTLIQNSKEVKLRYEKLLRDIRTQCDCSCVLKVGNMKASERCRENARGSYGNDYRCVVDIIRSSFVCTSEQDLLYVMQRFLEATEEQASQWQVVRCKNRFDPRDHAARDRGYRDVLVNLRSVPDGLVTEVQFHIEAFFNRQHEGPHHKKYELIR
jgi:hypothetical protein